MVCVCSSVDSLFGTIIQTHLHTRFTHINKKFYFCSQNFKFFKQNCTFFKKYFNFSSKYSCSSSSNRIYRSKNTKFHHKTCNSNTKPCKTLNRRKRHYEQLIEWRLRWHSRQNRVTVNRTTTQANWCVREYVCLSVFVDFIRLRLRLQLNNFFFNNKILFFLLIWTFSYK